MNKYLEIIKKLIEDEIEAVEGYDKAISLIQDSKIVSKLKEIRNDELEHIRELRNLDEFDPNEEGDIE